MVTEFAGKAHAVVGTWLGVVSRGEPEGLAPGSPRTQTRNMMVPDPSGPCSGGGSRQVRRHRDTTSREGYDHGLRQGRARQNTEPCYRLAHVPTPYGSGPVGLTLFAL